VSTERYWEEIEIPYFPSYAYEELLAPFEKFSGSLGSMLPALEKLAGYVTRNKVQRVGGRPSESQRLQVVASYEETGSVQPERPLQPVPRSTWRSAVAASAVWVVAVLVVASLLRTVFGEASPSGIADRLIEYASAHEQDPWVAASVLGAIDSDAVSTSASVLASRLVVQPIPYAVLSRFVRMALHPDGRLLVGLTQAGVLLYNVVSLSQPSNFKAIDASNVSDVQFSPDGDRLMTLGPQAVLYETASGKLLASRTHPNQPPSRTNAIASGFDAERQTWTVLSTTPSGELVAVYDIGRNPAVVVAEFPDDSETYRPLRPLPKRLSADGARVAIAEEQGVSVWTLRDEIRQHVMTIRLEAMDPLLMVAVSSERARDPKGIHTWDLLTGAPLAVRQTNDLPIKVALTPGGKLAAFGYDDGRIEISRAESLVTVRMLAPPKSGSSITAMSFNRDGTWLATVHADDATRVWRLALPDLGPNPSWPALRDYLRAASGGCVPPAAREDLYRESPSDAELRFVNCRAQRYSSAQ
jgi:hypothetical protein